MATPSESTFGEILRRLRKAAGLTQAELAERAGLSPRGLNDLERGARTTPRRETVALLADALGLAGEERAAFVAAARRTPRDVSAPQMNPTEPPTSPSVPSAPTIPAIVPPSLPSGTVTFLFTDIEGSTQVLQRLRARYAEVLLTHQRLLREAFAAHRGYEVDTQGDSFFVAFPTALDALAAAVDAARALAAHTWPEDTPVRVRMGLHSGAPQLVGERYVGLDVHRAARIAAAGHGGQILLSAATAELARHDLPEGLTLRDLGAHRLKDLHRAERIYQAVVSGLPAEFPPLRALGARPHNLPVQTSPLVGRARELEAVGGLLRREGVRLVTLTGPGGIGKTRMSLQAAADVLDAFPDGVWHVRLSRLSDPALVIPTIATTLGLNERGGIPIADLLWSYLHDKHLLLVLDNFEQVAAAAAHLSELLAACPGVRALVTSRVALHLRGEHEYALQPLALPDPLHLPPVERLSEYAAVALFIERAQAAQADFQVTNATAPAVAAICARLDGLPLAIELAAARVKLLPPPALLKRLERALPVLTGGAHDLDERQQTMRTTLAWSFDLLAPEEQRLFRRLAVFVGGWTLEAASAACTAPEGAEALELDLLDGLGRLVDHSLVQERDEGDEPRFGMLYVVREYALEQLEASGEATTLRRAHATYYSALAQRFDPLWTDTHQVAWREQLERDHDNLRHALSWLRDYGPLAGALELAVALGRFWYQRGHYTEGARWLEELLALTAKRGEIAPGLRLHALDRVSILAYYRRDLQRSAASAEEAMSCARAVGDLGMTSWTLTWRGSVALDQGLVEQALRYHEEGLALARQGNDPGRLGIALAHAALGQALGAGDAERALALAQEALPVLQPLGDKWALSLALWVLGGSFARLNDPVQAHPPLQEALVLFDKMGDPMGTAWTLAYLASVAALEGYPIRAARLAGAVDALVARAETTLPAAIQRGADEMLARARVALGKERWATELAAGRALSLEEAIAEALGEDGQTVQRKVAG